MLGKTDKTMATDKELIDGSYRSTSTTTETKSPKTTTRENQEEVTETSVAAPSQESIQTAQQFYKDVYTGDDSTTPAPTMAEIIGADPDKYYENRENQKKLNEFRRKEAQFYNGLSVIGDIASAAAGGNVFKRQKDTTAADAVKENQRLDDLTRAEKVMYEQKLREAEAAKQAAYQKAISDWYDKNTTKITRKIGGGYELTEEGGGKKSTTSKNVVKNDSDSNKKTRRILFTGPDNNIIPRDLTEKEYQTFKNYFDAYLRDVIWREKYALDANGNRVDKESPLEKYLSELGYITYKTVKDPSDPSGMTSYKTYVIDTDAILSSGKTRLRGNQLDQQLTNAWKSQFPDDDMIFSHGGNSNSSNSSQSVGTLFEDNQTPSFFQ